MISNEALEPKNVLSRLCESMQYVTENINCYCTNLNTDFTRKRKITVKNIDYLLSLGSKATRFEIRSSLLTTIRLLTQPCIFVRCKLENEAVRRVLKCFRNSSQLKRPLWDISFAM